MRKTAGFTLIELLIGLVVLAILLTTAIPAFRTFMQNNRLDAQANDLVAAAQFARSEALKRGVDVAFCSSSNQTSCGGGFGTGWIVIRDPGGANEVLRVWPSPGADFEFSPAGGQVLFETTGFADLAAAFEVEMVLDECSNDAARRLTIELSGRVASERIECD